MLFQGRERALGLEGEGALRFEFADSLPGSRGSINQAHILEGERKISLDISLLPITFQDLLKMLHGQGKFYLITVHQSKMIMQIDIFLLQLEGLPEWFIGISWAVYLPDSQAQFNSGLKERRIDRQGLLKVLDGLFDLAGVP